jgi:CubicO group peptidase (beta-lactamase class C family)
LKRLANWAALAVLICAVLVIAHDPLFWRRYGLISLHGAANPPLSLYEPRELVTGGNLPPAPREPPSSESLDIAALEAAADYAGAHQSRALIVSRHGYIVFEKYWQGTNFDTLQDSQSLGRIVAALAVGAALSERKIGWPDEPIGHFIPEWRDDPRGAITVRNLMQLSSGLAPPAVSRPTANPWSVGTQESLGSDMVARYLRRPLAAAPGQRWADQSADPDLLAVVIEKATGQRYAEYVSGAVWRRIGAADAWIWLDRPGGAAHVDRGFLVRQGDWIRVGELLLGNGNYQGDEVLVPRWVPQLLQPARSNTHYGSYLRLGAHTLPGLTPYVSSDVLLVEGGGNRLWLIPSLQIAILRTAGVPPAAGDWDDARIPNLIIHGTRDFVPPAARPGADLSTLVPNH